MSIIDPPAGASSSTTAAASFAGRPVAPARARHARPRVLHRRRVRAADRGRRRAGRVLPRHGEQGHPVPVHPPGDHPRALHRRLRGDEPPRRRRGRVLRLRHARPRTVPGVGTAFVALVSYNSMQFGIYGLFGAATGGFMADKLGITLDWYWWCLIARRDHRAARCPAGRPQRARPGRPPHARDHRRRALRPRASSPTRARRA